MGFVHDRLLIFYTKFWSHRLHKTDWMCKVEVQRGRECRNWQHLSCIQLHFCTVVYIVQQLNSEQLFTVSEAESTNIFVEKLLFIIYVLLFVIICISMPNIIIGKNYFTSL